jgi:hypothetical protein
LPTAFSKLATKEIFENENDNQTAERTQGEHFAVDKNENDCYGLHTNLGTETQF